ncbi:MAG TPA: response regulator [Thermoanaerobaculia bacterium]|nr:response regulator [Thermoanaerobaculia bacterium]
MAISPSPPPGENGVSLETPGILAIDDSVSNLEALEVALGELGARVVKAASGRAGLRALLQQDFAVILLDVSMPGLDGFETARLIRSRSRSRHVPIIFLTAFERSDREVLEAYSLGAVDFLFKPLVPEVLRAKVSVFVELQQRTLEVIRQGEQLRKLERGQQESRLAAERRRWENERLREENQRKDEFLAMLAHELRNPLSPMVTGIEILKLVGFSDDRQARVCASMERQVHHLTRLVDDLLDISRISRGKIEIRKQPSDLTVVVRHAVDGIREAVTQRRQELVEDIAEGPLMMRGDQSRILQLVSNLLTNANRYSSHGGRIEVSVRREGERAIIVVSDNGQGIRPEMQERIFDMFVQEREDGKGLGLGLTLVKRLVELHDGHVEVASPGIGEGSTFTVSLPLMKDARAGEAETASPSAAAGSGGESATARSLRPLVIALIEDEDDVRESTRLLLESWNHEVHEAANGADGIRLVQERRPDVALVDIGMPGIGGFTVARRVREVMGADAPYLVAVTGYGRARDEQRAIRAGFDSHVVKPASAERLAKALMEVEHGRSQSSSEGG